MSALRETLVILANILQSIFRDFGVYFALLVPSFLALVILALVMALIFPSHSLIWLFWGNALFGLASLWVLSGISVNIHRFVLIGDLRGEWLPFQFRWKTCLKYMLYLFVISLVTILPATILSNLIARYQFLGEVYWGQNVHWLFAIIQYLAILPFLWINLRLSMSLPATAINQYLSPWSSWKLTRSKRLVFFWAIIFSSILSVAVGILVQFLSQLAGGASFLGFWALSTLLIVVVLFYILFQIGLLTHCYAFYYLQKTV